MINETGGSWGTAKEVAGALNKGGPSGVGNAAVDSISCGAAGDCAAGGFYVDATGRQQAFLVNQNGGSWGTAEEVPGTNAVNQNGLAEVVSVSCPVPGICAAGGYYWLGGRPIPFVADEAQVTSASLALSAATVTYGKEQVEKLSITVTPQHNGTPAGTVTVKSGATTICTITLASAKGSCTLTASQLAVGTYTLVATYQGNGYYFPSASAKQALTVKK